MIHLPGSARVYLCLTSCDMRKSFDSLHALVREHLELDAFAGHLFVFSSRPRDRVKILYWDREGFALWSKRLEEATYAMPSATEVTELRREIKPRSWPHCSVESTYSKLRDASAIGADTLFLVDIHFVLSYGKSVSTLVTYSLWPSISNIFRKTPRSYSKWCWI